MGKKFCRLPDDCFVIWDRMAKIIRLYKSGNNLTRLFFTIQGLRPSGLTHIYRWYISAI